MSGDPLRDIDGAARIHVLSNTRCTETVTTNSFRFPLAFARFSISFKTLRRALVQFRVNVCFYPANGFLGFMPPRLRTKARERLLFFRSGV